MSKNAENEPTIDDELAPILDALGRLEKARADLRAVGEAKTRRATTGAAMFVLPLEDLPGYATLCNGIVTLENLKTSLENAYANDLRAVGYRRPVGEKKQWN